MKRILSLIMMLVMLTGFFACTGDLDNTGGNIGDKVRVQMSFTGLNSFAVTRAVNQTAVNSAVAYLFEGTDNASNLKYTIPVTLSKDQDAAGQSGTFEVPVCGTYHIEVIANAVALEGVRTYADFLGKSTIAAFDGNLVMQGASATEVELAAGQTTEINIELVRLAATFQATADEIVKVTDATVTLKNAVKASYLVKHESGESFTIPDDAIIEDGMLPYSYENPDNTTVMVITAKLNGADYTTEVKLDKVLRNHLYTVQLVDNNGSIEPKLTVTDWSLISAEMEIGSGKELMMTATTNTDDSKEPEAKAVYPAADGQASAAIVTVPAISESVVYYIWVGSANIEAAVTNTTLPEGWTLTPPADTRTDYLWKKGYWTLTIAPNTKTEAKTATITAMNKLVNEAKVEIRFNQEGKQEEVDHTKNPLAKWAETNLVRKTGTSGATVENEFAASIYDKGSYYQFGRNHGFNSYTEADNNNQYGACKKNVPSSSNVYDGKGTGGTPSVYNNNTNISKYPTLFLIHDEQDYWPYSNSNQTWEERAYFCGYSETNPCPAGWKLPTKADYALIMPTNDITSNYASNLIPGGTAELRTLSDGTKYAIRWEITKNSGNNPTKYFLQIKALVVPISCVNVASVNWEDTNVVTRYFVGSGYIYPYFAVYSGHYYARPLPFGTFELVVTDHRAVQVYSIVDKGNITGNYWTSDSSQACMSFRYDVDNTMKMGSWIRANTTFDAPCALPIRCIKAE